MGTRWEGKTMKMSQIINSYHEVRCPACNITHNVVAIYDEDKAMIHLVYPAPTELTISHEHLRQKLFVNLGWIHLESQ